MDREKLYMFSLIKLRKSLPKFLLLLIFTFTIYIFTIYIFIPLGKEAGKIYGIETAHIVNLISIIFILIMIGKSFKEIENIGEGFAGICSYFLYIPKSKSLERTMKGIFYVFFVSILFLLFKNILTEISPFLPGMVVILLTIISFTLFYSLVHNLIVESEIKIRKALLDVYIKKRKIKKNKKLKI